MTVFGYNTVVGFSLAFACISIYLNALTGRKEKKCNSIKVMSKMKEFLSVPFVIDPSLCWSHQRFGSKLKLESKLFGLLTPCARFLPYCSKNCHSNHYYIELETHRLLCIHKYNLLDTSLYL